MFQHKRFARISLLDPVHEDANSRPTRKGGRYVEDDTLQQVLWDKGLAAAKTYALAQYQGVQVAVFVA